MESVVALVPEVVTKSLAEGTLPKPPEGQAENGTDEGKGCLCSRFLYVSFLNGHPDEC